MGEYERLSQEELIASINQNDAQNAETVTPTDMYSEMVARYENDSIQAIIQKLGKEKVKTGETLNNRERAQLDDTLLEAYAAANRIGQELLESIDQLRGGTLKEEVLPRLSKRRQKRYRKNSVGEMFRRRDLRKPILDALNSYSPLDQDDTSLVSKIHDVNRIAAYMEDRMGIVVHANTRLIFHYLKRSGLKDKIPSSIYEDIVQEGRDGLCEAVNTFDKEKGGFSTRAITCIEGRILHALPDNLRSVRLPDEKRAVAKLMERIYQQLASYQQSGDQPAIAPEDIYAILLETLHPASPADTILNSDQKQHFSAWLRRTFTNRQLETIKTFDAGGIQQALSDARMSRAHVSLDAPQSPYDPTSGTRQEFLVDPHHTENSEQATVDALSREELRKELGNFLSGRELYVIERFYGLYDGTEYTEAEIARQLDVSRQRVEQILKPALQKLQKRQALFKDFLL